MSGKIFSDADMTVRVERNPVLDTPQGKKQFDGLVYQMTCQICETPTKTGIAWREIRLLLDGGLTQGVERAPNGWVVGFQCNPNAGGCGKTNKFVIEDAELEREAASEVSRRKRLMQARGRQNQAQNLVPGPGGPRQGF